ncbi:biotin transporter BioY [Clostridium tetani]|uniref:Biotin transporter n=1 Tax=Clostridium tetani TaxID=1513 RepID=A0ABY0EPP5_CLOTA|nr:biotin transporter BioY [Clostridium tetani]CDI50279.1 bioY protein [Clostridium tetani 12124569]KHO36689.1 BioY family protein [Clostridium tetani]RXI39129.1 biotin transporter BioY [Clostridium tetani]RXI56626.1 biotin transporter BioY [Clostridium tetani]RXI66025.1 biotin transporter BioY [Clostridium tetani]
MKNKFSVKDLSIVATFTALTAVMSQISIPLPFSPIPITLQIFAIYLAAIILGSRLATLSQIIYLLLGAVGAPVFSHFSGGLQALVGPTGGFLISFPIIAFIVGKISEKDRGFCSLTFGLIISLILCYAMGVLQLSIVTKMPIKKAIMVGAVPFVPLDLVKIFIAYLIGTKVRNSLIKSNLLNTK